MSSVDRVMVAAPFDISGIHVPFKSRERRHQPPRRFHRPSVASPENARDEDLMTTTDGKWPDAARSRTAQALTAAPRPKVKTLHQAEEPTMSDHTPTPGELDPEEGTEPDGTLVENPSGGAPRARLLVAA